MQIGNYILDNRQEKIVKENHDYLLVSAGAGSGKTLTILGKISYLINEKKLVFSTNLVYLFLNKNPLSIHSV